MEWIKPKFSRSLVNRAGNILKNGSSSEDEEAWAREVLSNWRSSHIYPLNTFNSTLRDKLEKLEPDALIAEHYHDYSGS